MNSSENQRFSEVFLFTPCPVSAQNIEVAGVQEGCRKFCTRNCTLLGLYFTIFQYVAMNVSCKGCTLSAHREGAVLRLERRYIKRGQRIFPVGGGECVWGVLIQPACGGTNIDYSVFGVTLKPCDGIGACRTDLVTVG